VYVRILGKGIAMFGHIHLVYVRIPDKGINYVLANIYLVYVRIPGKGIKIY
jgi:hypothetical protein